VNRFRVAFFLALLVHGAGVYALSSIRTQSPEVSVQQGRASMKMAFKAAAAAPKPTETKQPKADETTEKLEKKNETSQSPKKSENAVNTESTGKEEIGKSEGIQEKTGKAENMGSVKNRESKDQQETNESQDKSEQSAIKEGQEIKESKEIEQKGEKERKNEELTENQVKEERKEKKQKERQENKAKQGIKEQKEIEEIKETKRKNENNNEKQQKNANDEKQAPESVDAEGVEWVQDVDYRENPPPRYPTKARVLGIEGTVRLLVTIDPQGNPVSVEIHEESGSYRLDEAARRAVRNWKFVPAKDNGQPVRSKTIVPVTFSLEGR
jgi:TonB family protein